jgi:hypothetical protein
VSPLPNEACWRAEAVAPVISNEALEGAEGVFLATHTPITGFQVFGSHAGEILEASERGLMAALSKPDRQHAFCVVLGEPGSGKSHLIRWLSVNWDQENDVKLLLQRDDGSLEGALRQLQEALPPEFSELFKGLHQRHRARLRGRANSFLGNLANALHPSHFDPPLEDVDWCEANLPGELLFHRVVREEWPAPQRILTLIEGADRNRNSETASFNLFDIETLARACREIRGSGVPGKTEKLAERLQAEAVVIREYREAKWSAEEAELELKGRLRASAELMAALNRRRNDAIQTVLGVSADGLKTLFRQVRRELAQRGKRLVLLLEDITSWEGIDDSLIDVLVTNADTRDGDMCPLISVVGVTPNYHQRLYGNYRGRVTHELRLGDKQGGGLQDVASLRRPEDRRAFAARYLAAVRAGVSLLKTWREDIRSAPAPPPNKCGGCDKQPACHAAFGAHDGVGLFPFTEAALERFFGGLNPHDGELTWKTPRGILQGVLSPTLSQPEAIGAGLYPTVLLENAALTPESRQLSPRLARILEARASDDETLARLQRLSAYWGDKERADTTALRGGGLAFAGIPATVFEALSLPWPGEAEPSTGGVVAPAQPIVAEPEVQPSVGAPDPMPAQPQVRRLGPQITTTRQAPEPPSRRNAPARSQLERQRGQLRAWTQTGVLESPSDWNSAVYTLLREIDPRSIGLDPYTFGRIFTAERVKIEGTTGGQRNYLVLKQETWLQEGLEAYVALRLDTQMSSADGAFHRQRLARLMRRLSQLALEHAEKRLPRHEDGARWSPIDGVVQVLLARAWLRGVVAPTADVAEQVRAVLSQEDESGGEIAARCAPWREFLNATHAWQQRYRDVLFQALSLSQGRTSGFGLADAGMIVRPLIRLRDSLRFDPAPAAAKECGIPEFEKLPDLVNDAPLLTRTAGVELQQIRGRAQSLDPLLRGRSIKAHMARLDGAINGVAEHLLQAAPDRVDAWTTALRKIAPRLAEDADRAVEDLLGDLAEDGAGPPSDGRALLAWLATAPARDLEEFRAQAALGEQVIETLLAPVRDCVADLARGGGSSLEAIHAAGQRLREALHQAETSSEGEA